MKSLIMLAGLLVLASCSGGSSGGGVASGSNANQVRKGDAVSEQDLKEMLTAFVSKRQERGFQKKQSSSWTCDKEGKEEAIIKETVTVISVTGNARVERIETNGDSCVNSKVAHNINTQRILITKEESEVDISDISNAKILNQTLSFETTVEDSGEEVRIIQSIDLATGCILNMTTLNGKESYDFESSCKVVNIDNMDMKDDAISINSQENENGGYTTFYFDDLKYSDIEDKNISIIKLPEYESKISGYKNYISIK